MCSRRIHDNISSSGKIPIKIFISDYESFFGCAIYRSGIIGIIRLKMFVRLHEEVLKSSFFFLISPQPSTLKTNYDFFNNSIRLLRTQVGVEIIEGYQVWQKSS